MSTEILSHVPKEQVFENFEPRFRDLFRAGNTLLDSFHQTYGRLMEPPSEFFIDYLLMQARDYHASALGYQLDYQYAEVVGDERLAKKCMKLAMHKQALALIFCDAADRGNTLGGGLQNTHVAAIVGFIQQRVTDNSAQAEMTGNLLALFHAQRERGFRIPAPKTMLVTLIGDEGCPDTADIMRVTTAYRIPIDILIVNERHNDRRGFRRSNDHAIALYEDLYGSPPIPFVVFPNGVRLSEPSMQQFAMALFENNMI
jgi:hypothetical protein